MQSESLKAGTPAESKTPQATYQVPGGFGATEISRGMLSRMLGVSPGDLWSATMQEIRQTMGQAGGNQLEAVKAGLNRLFASGHISQSDLRELNRINELMWNAQRTQVMPSDLYPQLHSTYLSMVAEERSTSVALAIASIAMASLNPAQMRTMGGAGTEAAQRGAPGTQTRGAPGTQTRGAVRAAGGEAQTGAQAEARGTATGPGTELGAVGQAGGTMAARSNRVDAAILGGAVAGAVIGGALGGAGGAIAGAVIGGIGAGAAAICS